MADTQKFTAKVEHINDIWKGTGDREGRSIHSMILVGEKDGQPARIPFEVKYGNSAEFFSLIKVGEMLTIEHEVRDNKGKPEHWAVSINGVAEKKAGANSGARGGAGAGRSFTPKSAVEIHAPNIAAIIVACRNKGDDPKADLALYRTECANYQTATSGRQGAS